jgi:hypothetical protein
MNSEDQRPIFFDANMVVEKTAMSPLREEPKYDMKVGHFNLPESPPKPSPKQRIKKEQSQPVIFFNQDTSRS